MVFHHVLLIIVKEVQVDVSSRVLLSGKHVSAGSGIQMVSLNNAMYKNRDCRRGSVIKKNSQESECEKKTKKL